MKLKLHPASIVLLIAFVAMCTVSILAQDADNRSLGQKSDSDAPTSLREMQKKLQIAEEKKDYDEMLDRAEQASKISQELEQSLGERPVLTRTDLDKLETLEKLVKKVRNELGADKDDSVDPEDADDPSPKSASDAVKALQTLTSKMVDELKKTTRFGVSVAAIQSSNAVLKVVRFLKFSK